MNKHTPILDGVDLRKTYTLGHVKVPVLHGASITIDQGEWVAILGASGSGKSTLLHLLGGLDRPDKDGGEVRFRGTQIDFARGGTTNRYRNRRVGFVFQFYHLLPELDVLENALLSTLIPRTFAAAMPTVLFAVIGAMLGAIAGVYGADMNAIIPLEEQSPMRAIMLSAALAVLGAAAGVGILQLFHGATLRARIHRAPSATAARTALEQFGLTHRLRHRPRELSGGERQRVAIARALGGDPEVLLADEPTGNLDASTGQEILELLRKRHTAGLTIIMVTHDPKVAAFADRIVRLQDGQVVSATQ